MTVGPELVIWHIGNGQTVGALGAEHLPQVATGISHNAAIQELDCDGQIKEINPLDIALTAYRERFGQEMDPEKQEMLRTIINETISPVGATAQ